MNREHCTQRIPCSNNPNWCRLYGMMLFFCSLLGAFTDVAAFFTFYHFILWINYYFDIFSSFSPSWQSSSPPPMYLTHAFITPPPPNPNAPPLSGITALGSTSPWQPHRVVMRVWPRWRRYTNFLRTKTKTFLLCAFYPLLLNHSMTGSTSL